MSYPDWFRRLTSGQAGQGPGRSRARTPVLVTAVIGALVLVAGVAVLVAGPGKTSVRTTPVAESAAGSGGSGQSAVKKPVVHPAPPLHVVSVTPGSGAQDVNGTGPITVRFSAALAPDSPLPKVSPPVSGTWKRDGDTATFTPSSGFFGGTAVTVSVPGGTSGVRSLAGERKGAGGVLAATLTQGFTTAPFSTLRLQQLLAQLGYLPLTWTPGSTPVQPSDTAAQLAAAYRPPSGSFSWQGGYPSQLHSFWQEGAPNLIETGAIRAFESENGLAMDGEAGPAVWTALLQDVAAHRGNTNGYTYAYASKSRPETLAIWHDGRQVLQSLANTGIAKAPTADGTYPVYEKLQFQVMKGRNPDGSKYADPVYWVSYFNGSDAVHFFNRGSYGWPQSLGCVELPKGDAKTAYSYLSYGSLVTVQ